MKSTGQVLPASRQAHREAIYRDSHQAVDREVYLVKQDSTKVTYRERNHDVDRIVTEVDFQWLIPNQDELTSQCQVLMTTGCKIYSAEHAGKHCTELRQH